MLRRMHRRVAGAWVAGLVVALAGCSGSSTDGVGSSGKAAPAGSAGPGAAPATSAATPPAAPGTSASAPSPAHSPSAPSAPASPAAPSPAAPSTVGDAGVPAPSATATPAPAPAGGASGAACADLSTVAEVVGCLQALGADLESRNANPPWNAASFESVMTSYRGAVAQLVTDEQSHPGDVGRALTCSQAGILQSVEARARILTAPSGDIANATLDAVSGALAALRSLSGC